MLVGWLRSREGVLPVQLLIYALHFTYPLYPHSNPGHGTNTTGPTHTTLNGMQIGI